MRHLVSTVISCIAVSGLPAAAIPPVDAAPTADQAAPESVAESVAEPVADIVAGARPGLRVVATSDDERRTVDRAVGLYGRAGLHLPPLRVGVGAVDGCGGHVAVHRHRDGVSEIELCRTGSTGLEHILMHELAHAWAAANLTDAGRSRFRDARGWEHWNDHDAAAWRDRGTEQAAEVIKWGVFDRVAPILIDHNGCSDLAESFRILTGLDPVEPRTAACEPPAATEAW